MTKCIRLESSDGQTSAEGKFDKWGLLFLVLSHDGLKLVSTPKTQELVYAAFFNRGRRIVCAVLRDATLAWKKDRVAEINPGDQILIGVSCLSMSVPGNQKTKGILKVASLAMAVVIVGAFVVVKLGGEDSVHPLPIPLPSREREYVVTPPQVAGNHLNDLIAEARGHLREGRIAQARLSLIEAIESSPDDEEAKGLLKEISSDEVSQPQDNAQYNEEEALGLFREAQRLKDAKDLAGARISFNRAGDIIRKLPIPPPFTSSLEEARLGLEAEIKETMSPKLVEAGRALNSIATSDAPLAITKLVTLKTQVSEVIKAMPSDENARTLALRIDELIRSSAARWLSGAMAAERFSGCQKAIVMYEEIAAKLKDIEPNAQEGASEGVRRCLKGNHLTLSPKGRGEGEGWF